MSHKFTPAQVRDICTQLECTEADLGNYAPFDLIEAWLHYQGIIGYTADIINVIERGYDTRLQPFGWND